MLVRMDFNASAHKVLVLHAVQLQALNIVRQFPWSSDLSEADQLQCANGLLTAIRADAPGRLLNEIYSWRGTAEALADGLGDETSVWLETDEVQDRSATLASQPAPNVG